MKSDVLRLISVVLFFGAVAYILHLPAVEAQLDVKALRERFQGHGWQGQLSFILFAALLTGVGVPRLWVSVAAGALFGAVLGAALGHVASLVGATINFLVARSLLRGPIKRRMPHWMHLWYERFNENGFRWLLYMRLFPLTNATLTNTIGGVSRMKFGPFFAATFIGYLPLGIVFALFGSSAAKRNWAQLAVAAGVFLCVVLGRALYMAWRKRHGARPGTN
jgi:uncharacterized membrane protein YdjX (TVP38/TMEM64 family)